MAQEFVQVCYALGLVALHSLWQMAVLYGLYRGVTMMYQHESAAVRHQFALSFYYVGACWMLMTWASMWSGLPASTAWIDFNTVVLDWREYIMPSLGVVYLSWVGLAAARFVHLQATQRKHQQASGKVPVELKLLVKKIGEHMGIRRAITIRLTSVHQVPGVEGWIKPILLLPVSLLSPLNLQQWEAILIHELAHIKRNDYFHYQLTHGLFVLMGFNPFARMLLKEIDITREMACDEWVMNFGHLPTAYAQTLLQLEYQRMAAVPVPALAATKGKTQLLRRVEHVHVHAAGVNPEPNWMQRTLRVGCSLILLVGFLFGVPFWASTRSEMERNMPADLRAPVNPLERMRWISAPIARMLPEQSISESRTEVPTKKIPVVLPAPPPVRKKSTTKTVQSKSILPATDPAINLTYINEKLLRSEARIQAIPSSLSESVTDAAGKKWMLVEVQESGSSKKLVMWLEVTPGEYDLQVEPLLLQEKSVSNSLYRKQDSTAQPPSIKTKTAIRKRAI